LTRVDEEAKAIGWSKKVDRGFPSLESNRGPSAFVRTLSYHFPRAGDTLRKFAKPRRIGAQSALVLVERGRMKCERETIETDEGGRPGRLRWDGGPPPDARVFV